MAGADPRPSGSAVNRPRLQDHLHTGMRVINTASLEVYLLQNIWAEDRQAQLVSRTGARSTVTYTDLFHHYECVQPYRSAA